tara:strand:+ start:320 stop:736 length:417 start_codon:yes stop_codon:yes gene_type:complete
MSQADQNCTSFPLIRNAEKIRDNTMDTNPRLNPYGLTKSKKWKKVFKTIIFNKIFFTNLHSTVETVLPLAQSKGLDIGYYTPSKVFYENLFKHNIKGSFLIVGHSNTTSQFVNFLLGEDCHSEIEDNNNSNLYIVQKC